ncbi:MAG TPA: ABC transporter ATP-binding protein [Ktedonobacterales bacterium]|nr:ABC transporter ATP-binding protein [Ktedonobacterales bacterium]
MASREFTVADEYVYNRAGAVRWVVSHVLRYKRFLLGAVASMTVSIIMLAAVPRLTGTAFNVVLQPHPDQAQLALVALAILACVLVGGVFDMAARFSSEILAQRLERDSRDELYLSLLGKSQTFHNRQQVGDIMARATNDVRQLNPMINPGIDLIFESLLNLVVPMVFIAFLSPQLLLAPLLFTVGFFFAIRDYTRRLNPVSNAMRQQFGTMNAGLEETITGIEVVKSTAQEPQERAKFGRSAGGYRNYFVREGQIQAWYLPPLILVFAMVLAFLHGVFLLTHGQLTLGGLVAYLGLMGMLRGPAYLSIFTFSLVQLGIAGANRILALMREETELDENEAGHRGEVRGEIVFDHVSFSYGATPILRDISFRAAPGETIAIVGQTGSGKSTLTRLVNRTYDVTGGRILIDGVDVREWNLDSLRSQISSIEQDVFLFSRSIAENIGFSTGQRAERAEIERAARDAQADGFVRALPEGYETVIGERGVTLSGGQRQRLAIARALLTDPRILMLDDSTSAIDSATEDEIQKAIRRLLEGRTTLLITHRLSQIRWADRILVLRKGELIDSGTHEELLGRCDLYRRIFARYDRALPVATA